MTPRPAPRCHCGRFMSRCPYFDGIAVRFFRVCWRCLYATNAQAYE